MIYGGPTIPAKNAATHPISTSVTKHAIAAQSAQSFIRNLPFTELAADILQLVPGNSGATAPAGHTPDLRPAGAFPSQAQAREP